MTDFISRQVEPLSLLKKTLALISTLVVAAACFAFYLVFTNQGTQTALRFLADFTPYQIEFSELSGCLAQHLDIQNLHLKGPDFELQAEQFSAGWQLLNLTGKQKSVDYLIAKKMKLTLHTNREEINLTSPEASLATLETSLQQIIPIPFHIKDIEIQDSVIDWPNHEHTIKEFKIKNASQHLADITELHYQGSLGAIHANLTEGIKIDWDLHFTTSQPWLTTLIPDLHMQAFNTQGHIHLYGHQILSPLNKLQIAVQTKELYFSDQPLQNVSLKLQGNLAAHAATLTGKYKNQPIHFNLMGRAIGKKWQGKIKNLEIKHAKWEKPKKIAGDVALDWQDKNIVSTMAITLNGHPIQLQAKIEKKSPYTLTGSLHTQTNHLKMFSAFIPDLEHIEGKLQIHLKLAGTLLQPKYTGQILLKGMKIRSTTLKTKAIIESLNIALLDQQKINITGQGQWGSGTFNISGNGQWHETTPALTVHLNGQNLLLSDSSEYYIVANPALTFSLKNGLPLLEGRIIIPQADIKSLKNPDMVMPSRDIVIVSSKKTEKKLLEKESIAAKLATNIEIILGNKITYKGYGFSSQVLGHLRIKQQPGQPPLGQGKLILKEGKYRDYGKTFDIAYGQLLFSGGPIDDPTLDIQAQRVIRPHFSLATLQQNPQPITAGIKFTGSLKAPHISFYSNPHMPDTDVMSYLVVGRPQNQVNEAQAELLFQAVSQLASVMGKNRKDVNLDLAERLKLDQFGFSKKAGVISSTSTNPLENTVFVLGKQLSDRLYLHYSVGLLDSANNVGLRYLLGKNLTIEAAAGKDGPSADVLLSLEGR